MVAHQAPLFMGSSRQEYYSGLPLCFPGDISDPGIEPRSSALQADSLLTEPIRRSPEDPVEVITVYLQPSEMLSYLLSA